MSVPSSTQGKPFKETEQLKPQKLLRCASEEGKFKEKSLEKPKLKPQRLPELQGKKCVIKILQTKIKISVCYRFCS